MKAAGLALALTLGLTVFAPAEKAEAKTYFSFGIYGPGYYGGAYDYPYYRRRHYRHDYFGPRYYGPDYYYGPRYYSPRIYRPHRHRRGGGCGYWSRQCGNNWGYNNPDFYGCLRYHGC
jgi:hypothetical protein